LTGGNGTFPGCISALHDESSVVVALNSLRDCVSGVVLGKVSVRKDVLSHISGHIGDTSLLRLLQNDVSGVGCVLGDFFRNNVKVLEAFAKDVCFFCRTLFGGALEVGIVGPLLVG